jgi:lipase
MPDALDVPVSGGSLRVASWPGTGVPVLAVHGITSSSRSWPFLAAVLDQPVLAPDLRGRGRSNRLPAPYGIGQHADDCAAVIESVGGAPVVVVGHSMGGFVATVLAARRPDLVRALVLVDGGLPFPPADAAATMAGLQPIKQRLQTTYTREEYRDWFRRHPAFARDWTPEVEAYADYDLPDDPAVRPSTPTSSRPTRSTWWRARRSPRRSRSRCRRGSSCTRRVVSPTTRPGSTPSRRSTRTPSAGPISTYEPYPT